MPFRFKSRPAFFGGAGLLIHYSLHLLHGLQTGRILWDDMTTPLGRLDGFLFTSTFLAIDIALISIVFGLKAQKQGPLWLLILGVLASVVAIISEAVGLAGFLFGNLIHFAMSLGCLSMFVSALLLGIAALLPCKKPAHRTVFELPKLALLLIVFALTTAPLGFAFDTLEVGLPKCVFVELHFVVAGLIWLMIGKICQSISSEEARSGNGLNTLAAA
jgi:hypothetical protein